MKDRIAIILSVFNAMILIGLLASAVFASNSQGDGRSYFNVNQASVNEVGSGYGSAGTSTPFNEDGTGFFRIEVPVGAITDSAYTDDGIWFELGGVLTTANLPDVSIAQGGGTGGTYQAIAGTLDGANDTFTLPFTPDANGTTTIMLNGAALAPDGDDYTLSGTTITFTNPPLATDVILATAQVTSAPAP